jgi:putative SOS response-associated peptidase YedK
MCGRFERKGKTVVIKEKLNELGIMVTDQTGGYEFKEENIAPTNTILTVRKNNGTAELVPMKWGIKFNETSPLLFNSRIETINEKKFWATLFQKNKLLVPMTAFYEWPLINKKKVMSRIWLKDNDLFFAPALCHVQDDTLFASIITVPPNKFMTPVHKRMPALLTSDMAVEYLNQDANANLKMCKSLDDKIGMKIEAAVI